MADTVTRFAQAVAFQRGLADRGAGGQFDLDTMPALLDLPLPALVPDEIPSPALAAAERLLLESLARNGDGPELRSQALVELMALEVTCGNELSFERLRHELAGLELTAPVETLYRARVAWGLARFGRSGAAYRWVQNAWRGAQGNELREWLLEFDRLLDLDGR